ncbi:aminoglycoside phosphotransferase family protein [Paenibacillus sp. FSL R5-0517]|uniref:aminoglycoside phosphotransferase family protein n=1 Tax=unclassified Paenibacillus TaxID=185978 RepID=UPI0030D9C332
MMSNNHLTHEELQDYVYNVFGNGYHLTQCARVHGGAQKVIYKMDFKNGFTCLLYVWDISSNYFQEEILNEPKFHSAYGSELFSLNTRFLAQHGIRTPALYDLNNDRGRYGYDFALVEYVDGQKAEAYFQHNNPKDRDALFQRIRDMLTHMHNIQRNVYGNANDNQKKAEPCYKVKRFDAETALSYASRHMTDIRENEERLLEKLSELEAAIQPRDLYSFIHGELGPDHIWIDSAMQPCLIDIEGAGFFDLEHEHSFLEFRFGDFYQHLKNNDLDPERMTFYRFCHHLSLISGGLKLLHRQFPDQQFARGLAEYHARCAVQMLM